MDLTPNFNRIERFKNNSYLIRPMESFKQVNKYSLLFFSILLLALLLIPHVKASSYPSFGQFYGNSFNSIWRAIEDIFSLKWLKGPGAYVTFTRFLAFLLILIVYEELFKHLGSRSPIKGNAALVISIILALITIIFIPAGMLAEFGAQFGFIGMIILWLPLLGILTWITFFAHLTSLGISKGVEDIVKGIMEIILGLLIIYLSAAGVYSAAFWETYTTNYMPLIIPFIFIPLKRRKNND